VPVRLASAVAAPESSSLAEEKASCLSSSEKVVETRTSLAEAGEPPCLTSCPSLPAAAAGAGGTWPSCCSASRAPSWYAVESSGWLPLHPSPSGSPSRLAQASACQVLKLHLQWDPSSLNSPPCPRKFPLRGSADPLSLQSEVQLARRLPASLSGAELEAGPCW
jgi:hypothetical protein